MSGPAPVPGNVAAGGDAVADAAEGDVFAASRERFDEMVSFLHAEQAGALEHAELETRLDAQGRELLRQLMQDHLDLRAAREQRLPEVRDVHEVAHTAVEAGHHRGLHTIFGELDVARLAYRARAAENLYPADAALNLPAERHSHGLRRLAAIEASRGSYEDTVDAIERASGQRLGKRQVEGLAARAACDIDAFYTTWRPPPGASEDLLVLSCDGKGIVMRPDALRPATAKAAANTSPKLATRLSKGEKRNRKRLAELGVVYDATPAARSPADILPATDAQRAQAAPGPAISGKWLTASVVHDAAAVVSQIFDEADRRDPDHARTWIALVDGNKAAAAGAITAALVATSWYVQRANTFHRVGPRRQSSGCRSGSLCNPRWRRNAPRMHAQVPRRVTKIWTVSRHFGRHTSSAATGPRWQ